jgi:hypothetical protein
MKIEELIGQEQYLKIYDPVKQELIKECDDYVEAERFTGISNKILRSASMSKTRRFSPFLNKEIAIRVAAKK